jgi:Concanavalin A-like lectin/glucanases superfamily
MTSLLPLALNPSGLVLYLDASNNASYDPQTQPSAWNDLSSQGNHLTLYNTTHETGASGDRGIRFNGTTSYAYRSTFSGFNSSNFTLIIWMYCEVKFNGTIFTLNRAVRQFLNELIFYQDNLWDYNSAGYGFSTRTGNGTSPINQPTTKISSPGWYQLAFVKNGTSGQWYLNGTANGTTTAARNVSYGSNNFCFGKDYAEDNIFLAGLVSKVMFYNSSLTASDIRANYAHFTITSPIVPAHRVRPMVLYLDASDAGSYDPSQTQPSTWNDLSSKGNHVTLYNIEPEQGALRFNGTSSWAYRSTLSGFNSNNFTIIIWMYCEVNFTGTIFTLNRSPANTQNQLNFLQNRLWDYYFPYDNPSLGTSYNSYRPATTISSPGWYQIAFVKDGLSGQWYINGAAVTASEATTSTPVTYGTSDFCIGTDYRVMSGWLHGLVGKIMIYDSSLLPADIKTNYTYYTVVSPIVPTPIATSLVLYLDSANTESYNPAQPSVWNDLSSQGNSVTLYNTTYDNKSLRFNGTSSWAYRSTFSGMNSSNFTVIAWMYCESNYTGTIFGLNRSTAAQSSDGNGTNQQLYMLQHNLWDYVATPVPQFGFVIHTSSNPNLPRVQVSTPGWYQIAFVKDGVNGQWYLNGEPNGTSTATFDCSYGSSHFCIGKDYRDNNKWLSGLMNKLMIYNVSLGPKEIRENYLHFTAVNPISAVALRARTPLTSSLVLHLDAGDPDSYPGYGTAWNDLSGRGNHLVLNNTGFDQCAIAFDPSRNSYALRSGSISGLSSVSASNLSIIAWILPQGSNFSTTICTMNRGNAVGGTELMLFQDAFVDQRNDQTLGFRRGFDASSNRPTTRISASGCWYQLAFVSSGLRGKWYLNGAPNGTATAVTDLAYEATADFCIGADYFRQAFPSFHGLISKFMMYTTALTDAEILENYRANSPYISLVCKRSLLFPSGIATLTNARGVTDASYLAAQVSSGASWVQALPQGNQVFDMNFGYGAVTRYTTRYDLTQADRLLVTPALGGAAFQSIGRHLFVMLVFAALFTRYVDAATLAASSAYAEATVGPAAANLENQMARFLAGALEAPYLQTRILRALTTNINNNNNNNNYLTFLETMPRVTLNTTIQEIPFFISQQQQSTGATTSYAAGPRRLSLLDIPVRLVLSHTGQVQVPPPLSLLSPAVASSSSSSSYAYYTLLGPTSASITVTSPDLISGDYVVSWPAMASTETFAATDGYSLFPDGDDGTPAVDALMSYYNSTLPSTVYYPRTFSASGTVRTSGVGISGEWVQVALPRPVNVSTVTVRGVGGGVFTPSSLVTRKRWLALGSTATASGPWREIRSSWDEDYLVTNGAQRSFTTVAEGPFSALRFVAVDRVAIVEPTLNASGFSFTTGTLQSPIDVTTSGVAFRVTGTYDGVNVNAINFYRDVSQFTGFLAGGANKSGVTLNFHLKFVSGGQIRMNTWIAGTGWGSEVGVSGGIATAGITVNVPFTIYVVLTRSSIVLQRGSDRSPFYTYPNRTPNDAITFVQLEYLNATEEISVYDACSLEVSYQGYV